MGKGEGKGEGKGAKGGGFGGGGFHGGGGGGFHPAPVFRHAHPPGVVYVNNGYRYRTVGERRVIIVSRPCYPRIYVVNRGVCHSSQACTNTKRQDGWRWCNKCQNLCYGGLGTGVCASGGAHDFTGSGNYHIPLAANQDCNTQDNWRWCCKCQALFYAGTATNSCPAANGDKHDPTGSGAYYLCLANKHGQSDWNWCNRCSSMFYGPFKGDSKCTVGRQMNQGAVAQVMGPPPMLWVAAEPLVIDPTTGQPVGQMGGAMPMASAPSAGMMMAPQPVTVDPMTGQPVAAAPMAVVPAAGTAVMVDPMTGQPVQQMQMGAQPAVQMMPMTAAAPMPMPMTAAAPAPAPAAAAGSQPAWICQPHDPTGGGSYQVWHDPVQPQNQETEQDAGAAETVQEAQPANTGSSDDCCCVIL